MRFLGRSLAAAAIGALALAPEARAAGGSASLERARDAWSRGELPQAESLLTEALARGGMKRDQTLECYVRLGSARAVLGKKDAAQAAFRAAALIDGGFVVPSEAGKRAAQLAESVRKQQAGFGELKLALEYAPRTKPGAAVPVTVTMDAAHTTLLTRVALTATEQTAGKSAELEQPPAESMRFVVPASLTLPSGDITLRARALDANDNELAVSEGRVRVLELQAEPVAEKKKSGGFWSTPWPYVIGIVAVGAAAGTVGAYLGTQSPSQVNVGAPTVRPGS